MTETSTIKAEGLHLTFETNDGPVHALKDVNLEVKQGDFVSFIGPSGCGKTTFLRCIAGLETPTSGDISVNGMSPDEARRARAYGYVFQAAGLYPWRTIGGNIRLPLEIMGFSKSEMGIASNACLNWLILKALTRNSLGNCQAACSNAPVLRGHWRLMLTFC